MPEHDTILTVLASSISLAGLLLIFSGFLIARAATFETKRGDRFKNLAKATLIPVLLALLVCWMSVRALEGSQGHAYYLLTMFKITLLATGAYAIVGILASS